MGAPLTNEVRGFFNPLGAWGRMTSPVPYRGWIMKVTPDGKTIPWAAGLREPNGLGFDPQGRLFAIDNQGDWVGHGCLLPNRSKASSTAMRGISIWREDFQGGKQPLDVPVEELDRLRTRPAVIFPYGDMSNSPTQPMWDTTGGKFGPFSGQALLGEMNQQYLMRVMLEDVDGQTQGAVTPFLRDTKNPKAEPRQQPPRVRSAGRPLDGPDAPPGLDRSDRPAARVVEGRGPARRPVDETDRGRLHAHVHASGQPDDRRQPRVVRDEDVFLQLPRGRTGRRSSTTVRSRSRPPRSPPIGRASGSRSTDWKPGGCTT